MGVYFEDELADIWPITESQRLKAVERHNPLRFRGHQQLENLVEEAAAAYGTSVGAVSVVMREQLVFLARTGTTDWGSPRNQSFCAIAIQKPGEPLVIPDATLDPRFSSNSNVSLPGGIRFYAGVTINDILGYPLGALCVIDYRPRFETVDLTVLTYLAKEAERVCNL